MKTLLNFAKDRHRILLCDAVPADARARLAGIRHGEAHYAETQDGGTKGFLVSIGWRWCTPMSCLNAGDAVLLLSAQADELIAAWPGLDAWVQVIDRDKKLATCLMAFVPDASHLADELHGIVDAMERHGPTAQGLAA